MIGIGVARRILEAAWQRLFGYDIFITYTRRDGEAYAHELCRALENKYLVFLDHTSIQGGQAFRARIQREIRRCQLHLVVITPKAVNEREAPWIFDEVDWHFARRREPRIQTIFFLPNTPNNLPNRLKRLAQHKGVFELPGAELAGSPSIHVLEAITGRESYRASQIWTEALASVEGNPNRLHAVDEIRSAFSAVRQRTRMIQTGITACCLLLTSCIGAWWAHDVAQRRLTIAGNARSAETSLRFMEAEELWQEAARLAPWGKEELRSKWQQARNQRLLTPAADIKLPPGWRTHAVGSSGGEWRVVGYRMHDSEASNGLVALIDQHGWRKTVPTGDDFNPRVLFHPDAIYVHAAGKITRIPHNGEPRREVDLKLTSYQLASFPPQVEMAWKAGRLCVLAGVERPPQVFLLDPVTLNIESRTELKLPVDLPTPETEPDGTDRFGEAIFRLSTRDDTLAVAVWRRFTEYKVGVVTWGLNLQPKPAARQFELPMTEIGPVTSPELETFELSPGDAQIFLRITTFNFFGGTPRRSGREFWLALDTASYRPPLLMESMIAKVWPLPAHQPFEAYYRVDGGDLRALLFPDFVVTARPPVGVLRGVRAASLAPVPQNDVFTLAAATDYEVVLIRKAKPVFRIGVELPPAAAAPDSRLDHVYTDDAGHWLAASFEVNSEDKPERLLIWKVGPPAPPATPSRQTDLIPAQKPAQMILEQYPLPKHDTTPQPGGL
ncbi:toll/interleukin-1 receptor domain-containing protein [Phragmitibacter flavus]|nr:toll/interleukin-1 receptor domain-containing protein [Phragmitibacter flavus]